MLPPDQLQVTPCQTSTQKPDELRVRLDEALESFSADEIRQMMAEIELDSATRPRTACGLFTSNAHGATRPSAADDNRA